MTTIKEIFIIKIYQLVAEEGAVQAYDYYLWAVEVINKE
jgi:hypothetical protein